MSEQPLLRLVDVNGEVTEQACPHCQEHLDALTSLERKYRGTMAQLTRMRRNEEAEARLHKLWTEALTLHDWWALATGRFGVSFKAEDFHQAKPRIEELGPIEVLKAVAGAAFDPAKKPMANGRTKEFNDWELVTRSSAKIHSFIERAPGLEDGHEWKRWLIQRIESNLEEK